MFVMTILEQYLFDEHLFLELTSGDEEGHGIVPCRTGHEPDLTFS